MVTIADLESSRLSGCFERMSAETLVEFEGPNLYHVGTKTPGWYG